MKQLFILILIVTIIACNKVGNQPSNSKTGSFFKDPEQVAEIASKTLAKYYPNESFVSVERISYLQSFRSDFAFVFYRTNLATRSLVIKRNQKNPMVADYSTTVCWGYCDCKVKAIIGSDGSIDVGCSCTDCKQVTSTYQSLDDIGN